MTSPHAQEPTGASADAPVDAEIDTGIDTENDAESTDASAEAATTPTDGTSATTASSDGGAEAGEAAEESEQTDPLARAEAELAERTADLQRLQAEFLNYKRRVERDRELVKENATFAVLSPITEVLDTVDRAREHDALDEGLRAVGEQLEQVVNRLGLHRFGAPGDPFDPNLHDALSHVGVDPDVDVTTCKVIVKSGYRIGERVVRAAQVLVVDPGGDAAASDDGGDQAADVSETPQG